MRSKCNGGQLIGAVQVNLTPLISRDALATDAKGCSHLASLLACQPPTREIRVRDLLGAAEWDPLHKYACSSILCVKRENVYFSDSNRRGLECSDV